MELDTGRWVVESDSGLLVALVDVEPWADGGWFAGEIITCGA